MHGIFFYIGLGARPGGRLRPASVPARAARGRARLGRRARRRASPATLPLPAGGLVAARRRARVRALLRAAAAARPSGRFPTPSAERGAAAAGAHRGLGSAPARCCSRARSPRTATLVAGPARRRRAVALAQRAVLPVFARRARATDRPRRPRGADGLSRRAPRCCSPRSSRCCIRSATSRWRCSPGSCCAGAPRGEEKYAGLRILRR